MGRAPGDRLGCHLGGSEQLDLANDAIAAAEFSCAAGILPDGIAAHAHWIGLFKDFNWGVPGIGHMGVNGGNAIEAGAGAHAAGDSFVVGEWRVVISRVAATQSEIVHGALAGGGDARGRGLGQRAE